MKRIIILSCSKRKRADDLPLTAIERYDGTAFRVLRRFLRTKPTNLEIFVLSAKYGLIEHSVETDFYEQKLQKAEIAKLQRRIIGQAREQIFGDEPKSVFANLGKFYRQAFKPLENYFVPESSLIFAEGSSGKRLAALHDWLYGANSSLRQPPQVKKSIQPVKLRGVEINFCEMEILQIARQNLNAEASNFQSWFVQVDDLRVSPKWLVSQISDLPVGTFHSDEARRVLSQLGIEVRRL